MKLMQKLNKMKQNKKGFTLVELIIAIVILAILAAILIPSFIGYVNKANDAQALVEGRAAYLAATTIAAEGSYKTKPEPDAVVKLAALVDKGTVSNIVMTDGNITLDYTSKSNGKTINMPAGTEAVKP